MLFEAHGGCYLLDQALPFGKEKVGWALGKATLAINFSNYLKFCFCTLKHIWDCYIFHCTYFSHNLRGIVFSLNYLRKGRVSHKLKLLWVQGLDTKFKHYVQ